MFHVINTISKFSAFFPKTRNLVLATALAVGGAFAQPDIPPAPYLPCGTEPTGAGMNDTVASGVDKDGYISLFDGATTKGWWQGCQTGHGGPAKWKVVPEQKALFSTEANGGVGGVLMTTKKYLHYELVWDYWPSFKNDGGIFNRTPPDGSCFQTVLDYLTGASLGGTWGERSFGHRDFRPFSFGATETQLTIPGNGAGEGSNWTTITQKLKAAGQKFDCPTSGCTAADWNKLWDMDNWNQLRLQFYGGTAADQRVRMKFWFRKVGATDWVPVSVDTTLMRVLPANYIGLQVHNGGRFNGEKGTWYRNIKYTPLTALGERIYTGSTRTLDGQAKSDIRVGSNHMEGYLDLDHEITIKDVRGATVQTLHGKAGQFSYRLDPRANGWCAMQIKTKKGIENRTFVRDSQM